jgi:protein involved in polysaccharide export with SLBB domain
MLMSFFTLMSAGCTAVSVGVHDSAPIKDMVDSERTLHSQLYAIKPGDDITVRFYYNPQLDEDLRVRPDGRISLSLVGELTAAGKLPEQLSSDITTAYSHYFVKSNAVVILRHSADDVVFIAGEVRAPQQISIEQGPRHVLDCLAISGGVTDNATLRSVILVRRSTDRQHPLVTELDLSDALSGSDSAQNLVLLPGDLIYVPKSGLADTNLAIHLFLLNNLNLSTGASASASHSF